MTQRLRRGEGPIIYPTSRRAERLFGEQGRTKRTTTSSKIKLEKLGDDYNPRNDSVLKALVRLMAAAASDGVAESDADANVA